MTNWTTACLCTADPQLFSHDLLTALGMPAAGCIFFGLAKTGTRKKINRRLNVFHNVLIYSVTTLRLSLETITPMIKQSNTAQWWCMKCRPLLYYQLCPQCEQRCLCSQPPFCSGNMEFLICCLSSVIFLLNIMWSLCCHSSTIDVLEGKWSAQLEAGLW